MFLVVSRQHRNLYLAHMRLSSAGLNIVVGT
jgi:hypothetical protein